MKKIIILIVFIVSPFIYSQNTGIQEDGYNMSVEKEKFLGPNLLNGRTRYGKTFKESEFLNDILLYLNISGISKENIIDFNKFSLVDHQTNFRHRPEYIYHVPFEIPITKLENFKGEDTFLKYTQDNIKNYDLYLMAGGGLMAKIGKTPYRARFKRFKISGKKTKKRTVKFTIPVKTRNEGSFSFYYKDKLIKTFNASKRWTKFKD